MREDGEKEGLTSLENCLHGGGAGVGSVGIIQSNQGSRRDLNGTSSSRIL